jgi:hypothetical protein
MHDLNWNKLSLLEVVEALAREQLFMISCESDLSVRFDALVVECDSDNHNFETDGPALSEAFSHYADGLVREGELHPEQYANYEYVGVLA